MTDITRDRLASFLVEAKLATYAAQGDQASVPPVLPGSHQLEYRNDDLFYRDIYFGGDFFVGQETVYHDDKPLWAMCYSGGIHPNIPVQPGLVYVFLQEALRAVTQERPFRGPANYEREHFSYTASSIGSVSRFFGTEIIMYDGLPVFQLRFAGGLLLE